MNASQLLDAVLALPPDDRLRLALAALESVDDASASTPSPEEWETAWAAEIESRLDANEPSMPLTSLIRELRARRA